MVDNSVCMLRPLLGAKTYTWNAALALVAMQAILQESAKILPQRRAAVQLRTNADVCSWQLKIVTVFM